MSTNATLSDFHTEPAAEDTWEDLGADTIRFNSIAITGLTADSAYNTGNLYLRRKNGTGFYTVEPGFTWSMDAPPGTYLNAAQFEVKVDTAGDGAFAFLASATIYTGV